MDNSKFEALSQKFPRHVKFNLNPVYYAGRIGIQGYIGALVGGALMLYLFTFNGQTFPYASNKTKREFQALPDFYSKQVLLYDRTVANAQVNL